MRVEGIGVEGIGVDRWVGSQSPERSLTIGAQSPKGKAATLTGFVSRGPTVQIDIRIS